MSYDSDATTGGEDEEWLEVHPNPKRTRCSPVLLQVHSDETGKIDPHPVDSDPVITLNLLSEMDALAASFPASAPLNVTVNQQPQSQPQTNSLTSINQKMGQSSSKGVSSKRKKSSASANVTSSTKNHQVISRQAAIVALLKKLPVNEPQTVWNLLKVFDFIELSSLASYQGVVVSPQANKKEVAEIVHMQISSGRFSQELSAASGEPLEPTKPLKVTDKGRLSSTGTTVEAGSLHIINDSSQWKVLAESDETVRMLGIDSDDAFSCGKPFFGGNQGYNDELAEGVFLVRQGWIPCSDPACEVSLEYDNLCYGALQIAKSMRPGFASLISNYCNDDKKLKASEKKAESLDIILSSLSECLSKVQGLQKTAPVVEKSNAETQTLDLVFESTRTPQLEIFSDQNSTKCLPVASKTCRFNDHQLGLVLKQVRGPKGLRIVLNSMRSDLVDSTIQSLLTIGDELLVVNDVSIIGLSFSETMDMIRGASRPLNLIFASSASSV